MRDPFVDAVLTFGIVAAELVALLLAMSAIWIALPGWARMRLRALAERAL